MDLRDGRYITPSTPATQVFFDTATPTTEGVIFDPNTPALADTLYVSSTNSSTWIYQDGSYITYTAPVVNNTEWYITGTTIDAGGNKTASITRSGATDAGNFGTKRNLTSTGASDNNKWWKVFDYSVSVNYSGSSFKAQINEWNNAAGVGKSIILDVILKRQSASIYLTVNVNSEISAFDLANFEVLYNATTQKITFYYRPTTTYTYTNWLMLNMAGGVTFYNTLIGASLSGQVSDAFTSKVISLNKVNGAFVLPTTAPTSGQVLGYLGAGTTQWTTAGLSYFTEAQNTTSPNATVPVDSLTAVTGTTNGDFAILPKGTGAIIAAIPDNTATGGSKRGASAIDFQQVRDASGQVASGVGSVLIGGSYNTASGEESVVVGGTRNSSSGLRSFIGGRSGLSSGQYSFFYGNNGSATGNYTFSFGFGANASGGATFYGTASGANSFSVMGVATGLQSTAFNGTASGAYSFVANTSNIADGKYSSAFGINSSTKGIASRISLGALQDISPYLQGNSQVSTGVVTTQTTTNTAISLLVYNGTAIALPLQNNEAIRVKGSIIGKQSATTNVTCYDFDCVIVRGTTAASTVIKVNNMNLVWDDIVCTVLPTLNADTTNGGLDIKSGGKLTTTIKWSARIDSTESILA